MVRNTRSTKATNVPVRQEGKAKKKIGKRATSPDFRNTTPTTAESDALLAARRKREAARIKWAREQREIDAAQIAMLNNLPDEDLLELGDTQELPDDEDLPEAPAPVSGFNFGAVASTVRARDGGQLKRKDMWLHVTVNLNGVDTDLHAGQVATLLELEDMMPPVAEFLYDSLPVAVLLNTHANNVVPTPLDIKVDTVSAAAQHVLQNEQDDADRARGSPTSGLHFHACFKISYNLSRDDPAIRVSYGDLRRTINGVLGVEGGVHINFSTVWKDGEAKKVIAYDKNGERGQVNVSIVMVSPGEYKYDVFDEREQ